MSKIANFKYPTPIFRLKSGVFPLDYRSVMLEPAERRKFRLIIREIIVDNAVFTSTTMYFRPLHRRFPLATTFVLRAEKHHSNACDHSPPTLQTDGQTT